MVKGKGLKAALHSQQNRLKAQAKLSHSAQVAEEKLRKVSSRKILKASSTKGKKPGSGPVRKPTIPFKPTDRILLIGEGDFSFTRALVVHPPGDLVFLPPGSITATAYDAEEVCYQKYPGAVSIISFLRDRGVEVIFRVDATRLEKHAALRGRTWDRVVWNFPHAGKGITDQDRNILSNQLLLLGFLRSAAKMLRSGPIPSIGKVKQKDVEDSDEDEITMSLGSEGGMNEDQSASPTRGTVLITVRNVVPYALWNIPGLAKNPPAPTDSTPANPKYVLLRSFQFHRDIWRDYEHHMTKGERACGTGTPGKGGEERTWEFCLI